MSTDADLGATATAVTAAIAAGDFLAALRVLHGLRDALDALEPVLIDAARATGASWQEIAPALGVASRQAAERRYLRLAPATTERQDGTRDGRVRQVRDQRAGTRAVNEWTHTNTADLRRLAAQITALADLGPAADSGLDQLNEALGAADATALPPLLAATRPFLDGHPALARQVDNVTADTARVRRDTQLRRDAHADTNP